MNPLVLVVHPSLPVTDFNSFIDWARKQSGGVEEAVFGATLEVATALLGQCTGIKLNTIKYRGGAPALQALLGGVHKVFFDAANAALISNAREGELRVIGVTSVKVPPCCRTQRPSRGICRISCRTSTSTSERHPERRPPSPPVCAKHSIRLLPSLT
jgi:hypothetical protein